MHAAEPIAALASPPGSAARGVIRICGGDLSTLIEACFEPEHSDRATSCPQVVPNQARGVRTSRGTAEQFNWNSTSARRYTGWWRIAGSRGRIPCDLWYWPDQRCYVGQPTVELHLPGSPPLLEKVLEDLHQRGIRSARPGEFTLRAFLAGKLDLVQAEAVLGVIDAEDDAEFRTALAQLAGGISQHLMALRHDLLELLADLEAGLDFVEEDISFVSRDEIQTRLSVAVEFVKRLLSQTNARMTSTVRRKVVLAGLPNAGKSTLFNRLTGRPLALVSPEQGTTTDYLRAEVRAAGIDYELVDTAGWEVPAAGISAAAQAARTEQLDRSDLILWCSARDGDVQQQLEDAAGYDPLRRGTIPTVRVWTKCDLPSGGRQPLDYGIPADRGHNQGADAPRSEEIFISAHTGIGIETLQTLIARHLSAPSARTAGWLGTTAVRCRDSLQQALTALTRAEAAAHEPLCGDELLAVDLRDSLDHLGQVVGVVYTDDLLDRIFSKFCIGK